MSKPRWKRIDELPIEEESELRKLADVTPGMTYYGKRARTAVMLPLPIAKKIAEIAHSKEQTVGQVIVDLLKSGVTDDSW